MNYLDLYNFWKIDEFFDITTRNELSALDTEKDAKEIEDRSYRDLEFGTDGLCSVMGAGTDRLNKYTVGKVTKGLGDYLLTTYGTELCRERGVIIGYGTRNNSKFFSHTAANVLSSMGIRVYFYAHARPIPQQRFSVKFWRALAGVVVTASHNLKEYKVWVKFSVNGICRRHFTDA